jgi:D-alanyl-lipoteichoic acid acyltransferase DltB (MBOAT superfamily)
MGIRLMKNFDHPYRATTVKEFWSRWHISLSGWFKDYLYIPLGGNRRGRGRHLFNILVVFMVSGLWHGAAWTFVIWGALHGAYQILGTLTIKKRNALLGRIGLSENMAVVKWIRRVNTFILVGFSWLFFRANSVGDAFHLIKTLFVGWNTPLSQTLSDIGLGVIGILTTVLSIITLTVIDRLLTYGDGEDGSSLLVKGGGYVYFIWIILLAWLLLLSKDMSGTFIYFQF